jgi:hypothetical protein
MSWLSKAFQLNSAGLNWLRGVVILDLLLVPLVLFLAIGYQQYLLSAIFGVLLTGFADSGGSYGQRVVHITGFAAIGAGLTALGFGIGGDAWGWLVLAAFAVTLAGGLAVTFGVHRFVAGSMLNVWFIVVLGVAFSFHHQARVTQYTWAQTLAWTGGAALWIVVTFVAWLVSGRHDPPQLAAEIPGDTSRRKLTRPLIMFAVLRALVIAATVAIAFGANLSHGFWMPIAAIVAMKPSLEQTTLVAVERLAGTLIGAAVAALLLLIPASEHGTRLIAITIGFEVVALVFFMHGAAIRLWNYTLYCAAIAAGVLILVDLPQPSNYGAEGDRILWTLAGAGFAVIVMFLAGLLGKPAAKTPAGGTAGVPAQRKPAAGQDLASPGGHGAEPGTSARSG